MFKYFINLQYTSIFAAIATLTGLTDEKEIDTLTLRVLANIWARRSEMIKQKDPQGFIYKILLRHVFFYDQSKK